MQIVTGIAWSLITIGVCGCGSDALSTEVRRESEVEPVDAGVLDAGQTGQGNDGGANANGVGSDGGVAGKTGADAGENDAGGLGPGTTNASFHWIEPIEAHSELATAAATTGSARLGTLPRPEANDGSVFVGSSTLTVISDDASGGDWSEGMRWTEATGSVSLGRLPGADGERPGELSAALAVNADGSIIVGRARSATAEYIAFRWTEAGGMEPLMLEASKNSTASHVSADGSVVVGHIEDASATTQAFRWTQAAGAVELGTLPGDVHSMPMWLSADGATIIGNSFRPSASRLFRWTEAAGMVELLGPVGYSHCRQRYPDYQLSHGLRGGGTCSNTDGASSAFIYGEGPTLIELGTLEDYASLEPTGISADGAVVVGRAFGTTHNRMFRWTEATGVESVEPLAGYDYTLSVDSRSGLSETGEVLVGSMGSTGGSSGFRFTAGAGLQVLAPLEGQNSVVMYGTTKDGSRAAGSSYLRAEDADEEYTAVVWGADGVAVSVKDQLQAAGVDLGDAALTSAEFNGSDDVLTGQGELDEKKRQLSWRARLP